MHILQVENMNRYQLLRKTQMIEDQMSGSQGSRPLVSPTSVFRPTTTTRPVLIPPGADKTVAIGQYQVSPGFFDAMGLKLLAGRWFDPNRPADDMTLGFPVKKADEIALAQRGINVVMNQYAIQKLGFKSPQDAIGKVVRSELFEPGTGMVNINIIGVVGDTRFRSVRTPIDPIMFQDVKSGPGWMVIRYNGDPSTVEAAVEAQWKQISNDVPFQAKFSEDIMRELYKAEDLRARIFAAFSSCRDHRLPWTVRPCSVHR